MMSQSPQDGPEQQCVQAISSLAIDEQEVLATATAPETGEHEAPTRRPKDAPVGFLTLPAELRLRIYEDVLVSRFAGTALKYGGKRTEGTKQVLVHLMDSSQCKNMGAGLLRTCRQVHLEANQIVYAQNTFHIREAEDGLRFLDKIGPRNSAYIVGITIWVSYLAGCRAWLQLLQRLATSATGLRRLTIGWGARTDCAIPSQRGAMERGLGDNLDFVRTLAQIQGLDELVIQGYYAKPWPAYLEKAMGVKVQTEDGYVTGTPMFGADISAQARERQEIYQQELYAIEQNNVREYQRGTEDLVP
ncbi:hypothetical protein FB567DRAFT_198865 [Paraphoma chrysanthemicola]|uniref:DUF7730 domain-containing protein n=1 Tax=Paraphoma chrysanthemicola TaxID=798071 RepID=A0A8K0QVE0_9PLEO|nr:hypothetical protein FB567DRAFT_198865 [Paraphoma chrysanthemicola]